MSTTSTKTVGVLALQGGFSEHINVLSQFKNINPVEVKTLAQLEKCDGLILPGGESTAISLSLIRNNLMDGIREFVNKKPVWGTCAGLILLSRETESNGKRDPVLIGGLNVVTKRNVFGSQLNSFVSKLQVKGFESPIEGVFIRAPGIMSLGKDVEILAELENRPVAVRQGNLLGTTFHPELTTDKRFHEFFISLL